MKGHKFDWRIKRRPPFCVFLAIEHNEIITRQVRMCRRPIKRSDRDPHFMWVRKRGTRRFIARHRGEPWQWSSP